MYYIETQTFRHFACFNEPKYHEYIKKVLRIGVEEVKADQIFFDNVFFLPEPKSCRCERCIRAFKEFLKKRYPTPEAAFRRFGYPDPDYVVVNDWDVFNSPDSVVSLDDPILQEWTRFRCETVARHCADFYDYIKSLNPKVSVGFNVKGAYGMNRMWRNGVYHPMLMGKMDFACFDVGGMGAHLDARTGALISEIRSYKMARTLGFSYEELGGRSLGLAFNPLKYIPGNTWQGGPDLGWERRSFSAAGEFFDEYCERYYTDTESVADVAVLRTWPSMAYSIVATLVPTILMEQVLIQHKIPFDLIFDEQMDRIGRYRAVILPGQESLSQAWVDKLTAYAQSGGTVLFTDNTADYNDWRETRVTNPLLALMGLPSRQRLPRGEEDESPSRPRARLLSDLRQSGREGKDGLYSGDCAGLDRERRDAEKRHRRRRDRILCVTNQGRYFRSSGLGAAEESRRNPAGYCQQSARAAVNNHGGPTHDRDGASEPAQDQRNHPAFREF